MDIHSVPKRLMQALYYPAVLGTGLVLFLNKLATVRSPLFGFSDASNYFGLIMLAYFSSTYIVNEDVPDKVYAGAPFVLDIVEIVLVFLCFSYLGFLEPTKPEAVRFKYFYVCLAAIPVVQQLWNLAVGVRGLAFWALSSSALAFLVFAAFIGWSWPWFNWLAAAVLASFLAVHTRLLL